MIFTRKGFFVIIAIAGSLVPFTAGAAISLQSAPHSHIGHTPSSMGHTGYRSSGSLRSGASSTSGLGYHSSAASTRSGSNNTNNRSKTYHPGITHNSATSYNSYGHRISKASSSDSYKDQDRKKAEEAKKKSQSSEIKSINRLISPPKPKSAKPTGPFVTK